jgi:hypothetical protein
MPLKRWIGFAGLALSCLVANLGLVSSYALASPCELKRLASVDLIVRNELLMVPVTVNGHPALMLVDTAAGAGLILSQYLKPLGLSPDHYKEALAGGGIAQVTSPDSFAIGTMSYRNSSFLIGTTRGKPDDVPYVGWVGMEELGAADFELDFANNKLNFYSQDHCPGQVVYWTDHYSSARIHRMGGNYYFPMELEGKKILAVLSTAASTTLLGTDVTRKLFGFDEKSAGTETETDRAGHTVSRYRAMALTGDGISIKNAQIVLYSPRLPLSCELLSHGPDDAAYRERCYGAEAPLYLGLNIARRLHLYFATKEKILYFSDANATK